MLRVDADDDTPQPDEGGVVEAAATRVLSPNASRVAGGGQRQPLRGGAKHSQLSR